MKVYAFIAVPIALASAALPVKKLQVVCAGDPAVTTDITVPVVLPIPGTTITAVGNATIVTFSNGTMIIKKLITFPGISATTSSGIDVKTASSIKLKQQDSVLNMKPFDPEVVIDIEPEKIDVTINGVDGNTAVDIFY